MFVCWPFISLIYLMLSWPYPLLRLFAGLSFFWYTYGWLVAKSKLFISPCLLSFFLSSFALMFRLFHHYYLLFFHSRHARFIDWLLSDVADQKRPDHEADIADRQLSPLCRCPLGGCERSRGIYTWLLYTYWPVKKRLVIVYVLTGDKKVGYCICIDQW